MKRFSLSRMRSRSYSDQLFSANLGLIRLARLALMSMLLENFLEVAAQSTITTTCLFCILIIWSQQLLLLIPSHACDARYFKIASSQPAKQTSPCSMAHYSMNYSKKPSKQTSGIPTFSWLPLINCCHQNSKPFWKSISPASVSRSTCVANFLSFSLGPKTSSGQDLL